MNKKLAQKILLRVKKDYEQIAEEFSATRLKLWEDFKFFESYIERGAKVLDMGCGNGRLYEFLKQFTVDYTGIDFSEKLIIAAKKRFPEVNFLVGDMLSTFLPSAAFDLIFCIASFHHLPSPELHLRALQEIKRLLKPDGYLIMTVWNLRQVKYQPYLKKAWWLWLFSGGKYGINDVFIPWGQDKKVRRYYYAFQPQELNQLLKTTGFEIVEEFGTRKGDKISFEECFNCCVLARPVIESFVP